MSSLTSNDLSIFLKTTFNKNEVSVFLIDSDSKKNSIYVFENPKFADDLSYSVSELLIDLKKKKLEKSLSNVRFGENFTVNFIIII